MIDNRCSGTKSKCIAGFQSLLQLVSVAFRTGFVLQSECERKVRARSGETKSRKERERDEVWEAVRALHQLQHLCQQAPHTGASPSSAQWEVPPCDYAS